MKTFLAPADNQSKPFSGVSNGKHGPKMPSSRIEIIRGTNKLLLVAPHGHEEDDEDTGTLTREIAQTIKCYAVIGEKNQWRINPFTNS
ncbi:MAG: hypothetical protein JRJ13_12280 [Deltaproteobacteria bacterium]|nr:hypothetical protein [Deltaproteobacteria bacterium]MBW2026739.1 hypothetical protein [Deltaproteobacteria bacterium]